MWFTGDCRVTEFGSTLCEAVAGGVVRKEIIICNEDGEEGLRLPSVYTSSQRIKQPMVAYAPVLAFIIMWLQLLSF